MKSTERHHLKEDQFVATLQDTMARAGQYRTQLMLGLVAVVVLVGGLGGYAWWRQDREAKSSKLLGEALAIAEAPVAPATPGSTPTPGSYPNERAKLEATLPKLIAAADAYPATTSGLAARYHAAATLVALGRDKDAVARYQETIDRAGANSFYGRMARLGLAEAQLRLKNFDPAITTLKELSTAKDDLPVDAVLMQLGRAYVLAGKPTEAGQTFKRVTDEFATSPYVGIARQELEKLKG